MTGTLSAPEVFATAGQHINNFLNCGLFSTDSIEGWICIFLLGFFVWNLGRKAFKFVSWSLSIIILWQVAYWLSMTGFNNFIPIGNLVRFDLVAELTSHLEPSSRLFEIATGLNNYVEDIIMMTYNFIVNLPGFKSFVDMFMNAINSILPSGI